MTLQLVANSQRIKNLVVSGFCREMGKEFADSAPIPQDVAKLVLLWTSLVNEESVDENEHKKGDSMDRLNTKRISYKDFEFGDFGFVTTNFDLLSRGHTQLTNDYKRT